LEKKNRFFVKIFAFLFCRHYCSFFLSSLSFTKSSPEEEEEAVLLRKATTT